MVLEKNFVNSMDCASEHCISVTVTANYTKALRSLAQQNGTGDDAERDRRQEDKKTPNMNRVKERNNTAEGLRKEKRIPKIRDYYGSGWVGPGPSGVFLFVVGYYECSVHVSDGFQKKKF